MSQQTRTACPENDVDPSRRVLHCSLYKPSRSDTMKKLLIAMACLTLGGCASTAIREVKQAEKDGPGIWNMYVYAVRGEWWGGVQTNMSGKNPIAADEEIINIRSSDHNLLLTVSVQRPHLC
jgi:hypothetical protein